MKKLKLFLLSLLVVFMSVGCSPHAQVKDQLKETNSYTIDVSGKLVHQTDYHFSPENVWSEIDEVTFRMTGVISYPNMNINLYVMNVNKNAPEEVGESNVVTVDYIYKNGVSYTKLVESSSKSTSMWSKSELSEFSNKEVEYVSSLKDFLIDYHSDRKQFAHFINETTDILENNKENKVSLSSDMLDDFKELVSNELEKKFLKSSEDYVSYVSMGNYVFEEYSGLLNKIEVSSDIKTEFVKGSREHSVDLSFDFVARNFSSKYLSVNEPSSDVLYNGVVYNGLFSDGLTLYFQSSNRNGSYMTQDGDVNVIFHVVGGAYYGEEVNIVIDNVNGVDSDKVRAYQDYFEENSEQTLTVYRNGTYQTSIPTYEELLLIL